MMNNEMLEKIEYLREQANVTYSEASSLLEQNDGDVMATLIQLEQQGRLNGREAKCVQEDCQREQCHEHAKAAKAKADSFFKKVWKARFVVERNGTDGEVATIVNVCAPIAIGVAAFVPCLTMAAAVIALATGHRLQVLS